MQTVKRRLKLGTLRSMEGQKYKLRLTTNGTEDDRYHRKKTVAFLGKKAFDDASIVAAAAAILEPSFLVLLIYCPTQLLACLPSLYPQYDSILTPLPPHAATFPSTFTPTLLYPSIYL